MMQKEKKSIKKDEILYICKSLHFISTSIFLIQIFSIELFSFIAYSLWKKYNILILGKLNLFCELLLNPIGMMTDTRIHWWHF